MRRQIARAQKLPYMNAYIQETFRMHPASAVLFERVGPPAGAPDGEIDASFWGREPFVPWEEYQCEGNV